MSSVDTSASTNTTTGTTSGSNSSSSSSAATSTNGLKDLNMDQFLQLMIKELQNQDPLDPMKNAEMLQQISEIRTIGATDQLRASLDSMQQSQGISTASSLIGKQVQALNSDGYVMFGLVKSVQLTPDDKGNRTLSLKVDTGDQTVDVNMDDVYQILPANATGSSTGTLPDGTGTSTDGTGTTTDSTGTTTDNSGTTTT
ncbi:flagellar biosynthesis protein FlgD [bacterium]|nr:flagellar biosynthesis protein FlgD [bacterium]